MAWITLTEAKKQSPNTGARANNTLHKLLGYNDVWFNSAYTHTRGAEHKAFYLLGVWPRQRGGRWRVSLWNLQLDGVDYTLSRVASRTRPIRSASR